MFIALQLFLSIYLSVQLIIFLFSLRSFYHFRKVILNIENFRPISTYHDSFLKYEYKVNDYFSYYFLVKPAEDTVELYYLHNSTRTEFLECFLNIATLFCTPIYIIFYMYVKNKLFKILQKR